MLQQRLSPTNVTQCVKGTLREVDLLLDRKTWKWRVENSLKAPSQRSSLVPSKVTTCAITGARTVVLRVLDHIR